jgi:hypothetical protein
MNGYEIGEACPADAECDIAHKTLVAKPLGGEVGGWY